MITFSAGGRLGNQLCQYVSARLLADQLGFALGTQYTWNYTVSFTEPDPGSVFLNDPITIVETADIGNILEHQYTNRHYHLQGYWQNSNYYLPNRDKILSWIIFPTTILQPVCQDDIVMHIRLTDYKEFGKGGTVLSQDYYRDCLDKEPYDFAYVITDDPSDPYLDFLNDYHNVVIRKNNTEKDDFWYMNSFDRIIISNSTFSWWSAFLSNASKIYTPSCWIRNSNDIFHDLQNIHNGIIVPASFKDY